MTFSAVLACRKELCDANECCMHVVSQCCALMHTGDCACEDEKGCCSCESGEPCHDAMTEARNFLAFGGVTHDLDDVLMPPAPEGFCPECRVGIVVRGRYEHETGHTYYSCSACTWTD